MKFKIDENLPVELADLLQEAGYDAMTVKIFNFDEMLKLLKEKQVKLLNTFVVI